MIPLTSSQTETYTPPALEKRDPKPEFYLSVPTLLDRDSVNSRLFALGVIPVTQRYVKASLIDELYNLYDEDKARELADLIEDGSRKTDAYNFLVMQWQERERERVLDAVEGVERPAEPMPVSDMTAREQARYDLIWEDTVNASPRLRALTAKRQEFDNQQRIMLARMHLAGWSGIDVQRQADAGGGQADLVTLDCLMAVRTAIGEVAWPQLLERVFRLYDLSREEVGNSDSLPESTSAPKPSGEPSGDGASSVGGSRKPRKRGGTGSST